MFTSIGGTGITGFNVYSMFVAIIGAIVVLMIYYAIMGTAEVALARPPHPTICPMRCGTIRENSSRDRQKQRFVKQQTLNLRPDLQGQRIVSAGLFDEFLIDVNEAQASLDPSLAVESPSNACSSVQKLKSLFFSRMAASIARGAVVSERPDQ